MADQVVGTLDIVGGPGGEAYALRPASCVLARSLAANTAESITVPAVAASSTARYALFSCTGDFYANYTTTATVPGDTAITDATASELNPTMRFVSGVTTISVIAPSACILTVSFWRD